MESLFLTKLAAFGAQLYSKSLYFQKRYGNLVVYWSLMYL